MFNSHTHIHTQDIHEANMYVTGMYLITHIYIYFIYLYHCTVLLAMTCFKLIAAVLKLNWF